MLEGRAPTEFAAMLAAWPLLSRVPRGDGHGVLVFPGLGGNELSTAPLRGFLKSLGYDAQPSGPGTSFGPRAGVLERCAIDVKKLADKHGEPASLIGWSLGGIHARETARLHPESTRSVITLGTPFTGHPKATNAWRFYEWVSGQSAHDPALMQQIRRPPPVPTTSIYSRSDGVVAWRCSLNEAGSLVENIEVPASHFGLGMNPVVLYAIADRLAQPSGRWQPFDATGWRRAFYRTGATPASAAAELAAARAA